MLSTIPSVRRFAEPVVAVSVQVGFSSGVVCAATVLLQPESPRHLETQTLGERLNARGLRFLPLQRDGRTELVALAHIEHVAALPDDAELAELDEHDGLCAPVAMELASGRVVRGELRYGLPRGACTVGDVLDAPDVRFLLVQSCEVLTYVRRDAVVRVWT